MKNKNAFVRQQTCAREPFWTDTELACCTPMVTLYLLHVVEGRGGEERPPGVVLTSRWQGNHTRMYEMGH